MQRYYLGLDSSTQSLTGLVIDVEKSRIVLEKSINFDKFFGGEYDVQGGVTLGKGGRVWSYPLMWVEALDLLCGRITKALKKLGISPAEIGAVSGSGQQHGTVFLNKTAAQAFKSQATARSLREALADIFSRDRSPIWMDSSTATQCAEIEQAVGGRNNLRSLTGNQAFARFSGPQIRKVFQEERKVYDQTAEIGLVSSFMASVLAGQIAPIDPGDGAGTNLMDIRTRAWSTRALAATADGLQEKLSPIAPSHTVLGPISPYFVKRFGLSADCQVVSWSGDNPCSLIGLGLVEPGVGAISLGTSDTVFACLDKLKTCDTGEGCVFASPDGRHTMALLCFANGGLSRDYVRKQFGLKWNDITRMLRDTAPGNRLLGADKKAGPFRILLPYHLPEIAPPVPHPLWVYHQLSPHDREGVVRGVIESRALAARLHSEWMGVRFSRLRITGGAAANEAIVQTLADVFNATAECITTTSSAALGAALRAWQANMVDHRQSFDWRAACQKFGQVEKTIRPRASAVKVYDEMLEEFRVVERQHTTPMA
ncbi:MAG: xylulokinase [Planctomycetota bacterium]